MQLDTCVVPRNVVFLRGFVTGVLATLCVSTIYSNVIVAPNKPFALSATRWEEDVQPHRALRSDSESPRTDIDVRNDTRVVAISKKTAETNGNEKSVVSRSKKTAEESSPPPDEDSDANYNDENDMVIDHVVMKSLSASALSKTLNFWSSNFELEVEGRRESREFEKNPHRSMPSYPSVHLNSETQLDFFPKEMALFYGKKPRDVSGDTTKTTPVDEVVDHLALKLSGPKMVRVLKNFRRNGVKIEVAAGDYVGKEPNGVPMFWGPWGARGKGIGVFLYDPNGMYIELRTYDVEYKDAIYGIVKDLKPRANKISDPAET